MMEALTTTKSSTVRRYFAVALWNLVVLEGSVKYRFPNLGFLGS
jgi:hypothetical protein